VSNTVGAFRGISTLIFKWLFFALVGIAGIALAVIGSFYAYNYFTYERHAAQVKAIVNARDKGVFACAKEPDYPIFVAIINNSSKTIEEVSFSLEARRKSFTTNLATYASFTDDKIRKPGEGWGTCWAAPLRDEVKDNPRDLEWKVGTVHITFEK